MVQVCSESFDCKVSAERMWHGLFEDAHNCLPKALPHHVHAVEYPQGQLGFHLPGHERLIKLHKGFGAHLVAALSEQIHEAEKHLKEEQDLIKEEVEKVAKELHKEEDVLKGKEKEVVGEAEKVGKEVVGEAEKVGKELHKAEEVLKKKAGEVVKGAEKEAKEKVEEVGKDVHELKEEVHKEAHFAEKEVGKITEKVLHKEAEATHKAAGIVEKVLHKEEEVVGGAFHRVDALLQHEELWIKEKIEEVKKEAFKITISVLSGGLIGILFKHCKHTFELKDTSPHSSILHWTSEFEALSSTVHYLHSFEKLEQHALAPFHSVEAYLLKHDDYTH